MSVKKFQVDRESVSGKHGSIDIVDGYKLDLDKLEKDLSQERADKTLPFGFITNLKKLIESSVSDINMNQDLELAPEARIATTISPKVMRLAEEGGVSLDAYNIQAVIYRG